MSDVLPALPAGRGYATVDMTTKLLNDPTMDALDARTVGVVDARAESKPAARTAELLARIPRPRKVMTAPPTVTLSAASAATSISGGITRAPKRTTPTGADGAPADMLHDPHFSYLGAVAGSAQYGASAPDTVLINWNSLTGVPAAQIARWEPRIGFEHTGQVLEVVFKGLTNPNFYRLTVNGECATEDMQSLTIGSVGSVYRLIVDFGSIATRQVIVELDSLRFGGVTIEPTASLRRLAPGNLRAVIIGDSISGGSGEVRRRATATEIACAQLGAEEVWNLAVGGTGSINNGGAGGQTISARIATDLPKTDPDFGILFFGYNDRANTQSAIQAAVTADLQAAVAAKPATVWFVVGCWAPGNPGTAELATNAAVKAAAAAVGLPFIDLLDPTGLLGAAAYSSSAQYRVGDVVTQAGVLYEAIAFVNATAFNAASWRGIGVINGTGRVGATASNGNADVAIQTDATHPTILGAKIVGTYIARRIYEQAREWIRS